MLNACCELLLCFVLATEGIMSSYKRGVRSVVAQIPKLSAKMNEGGGAILASTAPGVPVLSVPDHFLLPRKPDIMNYLHLNDTKGCKSIEKRSGNGDAHGEMNPPCDEESVVGRFGWETLGECYIPYIFRYGEMYCAVRIVELKLLNKYLSCFHRDLYSCICIRSYYITAREASLFNEINEKHCSREFGIKPFTVKDLVVRLHDVARFYYFLKFCYNKLTQSSINPEDKYGFIRINGQSVVPYIVRDSHKYVPLFYFNGETDKLKQKAEKLKGWDLAYLKFCCKVQGIPKEAYASNACFIIRFNDTKSYFPAETIFEDYWPNKDTHLLLPRSKEITFPGMSTI